METDLFQPVPTLSHGPPRLRDYQEAAVTGVFTAWEKVQAVIGCAPTGSGKTVLFTETVRRVAPGRALILAHRDELVRQIWEAVQRVGLDAEIEKADLRASRSLYNRSQVVIATPQTLYGNHDARLKSFRPDDFAVVIADELHHFVAPAFERILKYFKQSPTTKILGVTATPDRHDNVSLKRVIDGVAFDISLLQMIEQGWLVPIRQGIAKIEALDLSRCRVTAGDLNGRDLAEAVEMERPLLGMADAVLKTVGDKKTLVFCATVKQAERMTEIFHRYKPGSAGCVFGHTPEQQRRDTFKKFSGAGLQILVNVGVATEGYDNPAIEVVVMGRPTLSRALFSQMIGRGTRPLPGIVEGLADAAARTGAIAASPKPSVLVLDFKGNTGRHSLVCTADILGGHISTEARKLAHERLEEKGGGDVLNELQLAEMELREERERRRRSGLVADAKFTITYLDPFADFVRRSEKWEKHVQRQLSEKQRHRLLLAGINPDEHTLKENLGLHWELIKATPGQARCLLRAGYTEAEVGKLTRWAATPIIEAVKNNGWKRPPAPVEDEEAFA